jgi:hypothetical protein
VVHNFDKNAALIYLTLDGDSPSEHSTRESEDVIEKVITLSYQDDITAWLQNCALIAKDNNYVSAIIIHYLNLIKTITNQTLNTNMKAETLTMIVENQDYIKYAMEIANMKDKIRAEICKRWAGEICKLGSSLGLVTEIQTVKGKKEIGYKDTYISLKPKNAKYQIEFYFDTNFENLSLCIGTLENGINKSTLKDLEGKLLQYPGGEFSIDNKWYWANDISEWDDTTWENLCTKENIEKYRKLLIELNDRIFK